MRSPAGSASTGAPSPAGRGAKCRSRKPLPSCSRAGSGKLARQCRATTDAPGRPRTREREAGRVEGAARPPHRPGPPGRAAGRLDLGGRRRTPIATAALEHRRRGTARRRTPRSPASAPRPYPARCALIQRSRSNAETRTVRPSRRTKGSVFARAYTHLLDVPSRRAASLTVINVSPAGSVSGRRSKRSARRCAIRSARSAARRSSTSSKTAFEIPEPRPGSGAADPSTGPLGEGPADDRRPLMRPPSCRRLLRPGGLRTRKA